MKEPPEVNLSHWIQTHQINGGDVIRDTKVDPMEV